MWQTMFGPKKRVTSRAPLRCWKWMDRWFSCARPLLVRHGNSFSTTLTVHYEYYSRWVYISLSQFIFVSLHIWYSWRLISFCEADRSRVAFAVGFAPLRHCVSIEPLLTVWGLEIICVLSGDCFSVYISFLFIF